MVNSKLHFTSFLSNIQNNSLKFTQTCIAVHIMNDWHSLHFLDFHVQPSQQGLAVWKILAELNSAVIWTYVFQ